MSALGDPHTAYPAVHVTGTNGKGSVVRLTARLLTAMGLRVGAYTSPHLGEPTERIEVNQTPVPPDIFAALIGEISTVAQFLEQKLTWFETVTAAAFMHFADVGVDAAVIEVGMLGRYDATNLINASVATITNVGFDHTDGEGDWRAAIAQEKAGIIKPDSVVVCGEIASDLVEIFAAEPCEQFFSRSESGGDFGTRSDQLAVGGRHLELFTPNASYDDLLLSLHGKHQGDNAAVALTSAEAFFAKALPPDVVAEAMADVTVPGRFEIISRNPLLILDGAHNPDGACAAHETLRSDFNPSGGLILVIGLQSGRDATGILDALEVADAKTVIACTAPTARGIPAIEITQAAKELGATTEAIDDPMAALQRGFELANTDDAILVVGSFTVVGAIRTAVNDDPTVLSAQPLDG